MYESHFRRGWWPMNGKRYVSPLWLRNLPVEQPRNGSWPYDLAPPVNRNRR